MCKQSRTGAFRYPATHRVAVGLKRLGSAAWLGNAARQHEVSSGSVLGFTDDFVAADLDRLHGNVSWPSASERRQLREKQFVQKGTLLSSLAVGFVDGSIIPFKNRPSTSDRLYNESFYNYKGKRHGINLTAICDFNCKIRALNCGHRAPGMMPTSGRRWSNRGHHARLIFSRMARFCWAIAPTPCLLHAWCLTKGGRLIN